LAPGSGSLRHGGLSGAALDRPALQTDVRGGKVTIVVVYKVDRLTRSLADFAKLVELFDQQGVSFVSITQSFNTTSSMGRSPKAAEKFGTMFGCLLPFRRLVDFQHRREISLPQLGRLGLELLRKLSLHRRPLLNQAANLESHPIHPIQLLSGRTLSNAGPCAACNSRLVSP
jgi:hypothetical protein